jgi:hypothetical protein
MPAMDTLLARNDAARPRSKTRAIFSLPAIVVLSVTWQVSAAAAGQSRDGEAIVAQNAAAEAVPRKATPAQPEQQPGALLSWNFASMQAVDIEGWTAERGTVTLADGGMRMQPDSSRRVVLLSPTELPEGVRDAREFVVNVKGTGLLRVRVQARRDARGGWITLADAGGSALRETADGFVVKRKPGVRDAPIERLRIEFLFRTTNPRTFQQFAAR